MMSPVLPPPMLVRPPAKSRRGLITTIAAVCIVALLGGGAYWAFAAFLNPAHQLETAREVPDTTFAYASLDLVAMGNNTHHYSTSNPTQQQAENAVTQSAFGLNWVTDIAPWLGRDISVAAWPGSNPSAGSANIDGAILLQSSNDSAAQAAMTKAIAYLGQRGAQFTTSTYGGYTIHAAARGSAAGAIATGSGEVLITTSAAAAQTVIDRINGQGSTLANASDFQKVTSNLPADRFATIYLNLRSFANISGGLVPGTFLSIYPSMVSYLEWTQAGVRWQTNLPAAQGGAPAYSVSGGTTDLATMIPQSATVYSGIGNLGGLAQSLAALTGAASGDPLQSIFGLPSSDASLQQEAAVAVFNSSSSSSGAFLIHEPSSGAADTLINAFVQQVNSQGQSSLQAVPTQVGNVEAMNIESPDGTGLPPITGQYSDGCTPAPDGNCVIAVEAYINSTMVVTTSSDAMQSIIDTANGSAQSLAHATKFTQLVSNAPTNSAETTYVDFSALAPYLGSGGPLPTASLFTLVWNSSQLQVTGDISLNQ